jgi:hypothetical protein
MVLTIPICGFLGARRRATDHFHLMANGRSFPPLRDLAEFGVYEAGGEQVGNLFWQATIAALRFGADGVKVHHDLKSARAIASNVSFVRQFNSILSSNVPRMYAMACCSGSGGNSALVLSANFVN